MVAAIAADSFHVETQRRNADDTQLH
jgi:hypothetical protein